jgi:hypothetical protein
MARTKISRAKPFAGGDAQAACDRVPDSAEFCARLREHLAAELDKPCADPANGSMSNFQALSEKLVQMAVGGSKDAIHIVLDRMGGRVPQAAAGNDEGSQHIEYLLEIPRPNHDAPEDPTPARLQPVPPAS